MVRLWTTGMLSALALGALGCSSTPTAGAPTNPTLVAVAPADFAGEVPCTPAPGAMRGYVVTLFDLGTAEEPTAPTALPSSVVRDESGEFRPTPCQQTAAFSFVIPGHRYDAEVEAYDRADVHAVGAGSRLLVDDSTGSFVTPRWTTTCGRNEAGSPAEGPVTAAWYLTRFVRGCAPLKANGPETPTGIRLDLSGSLGSLTCGNAGNEVASFTASIQGSTEAATSAGCGETIDFADLTPGTTYFFDVLAFESGALTPRWGTTCFRTAEKGALVTAACDPLAELPP